MYKKTVLKNGARILTYPMPAMESVALGIWIRIGGRYETGQNKGISHYLEHLLFKGTKRYSCRKLKESIEGIGGSLNGFTSEEATCYMVKIPSSYISLALDILSDMVLEPLLDRREAEKERTVILEEIKMYRDHPQSYVYELLDELLWPGHPLGMSIAGSQESVSGISRDDVALFRNSSYTSSNILVCAAGKIKEERFIREASRRFSSLKESARNDFLSVEEKKNGPDSNLFYKETEQTHIALAFHAIKREDPFKYAISLLNIILGGNMSSRLFNVVRENRGLAYEIGTNVKRYEDTGAFLVHAGIDNRKVEEALGLVMKEIARIRNNPVSDSELRRAKDFFIGQLGIALEDTFNHMLWIGESEIATDRILSIKDVVKGISKVTKKDISALCRHIFDPKRLHLAAIGPLQEKNRSRINDMLWIGAK